MRRRRMWRFVGRSGIVVAFISLVLLGMNMRWAFGYLGRWGILVAGEGFATVGIGDYRVADQSWVWLPGGLSDLSFLPFFEDDIGYIPLIDVALLGVACGFVGWKRSKPKPHGFCLVCSYNLTGNISGRCPECGTAVEGESKTDDGSG